MKKRLIQKLLCTLIFIFSYISGMTIDKVQLPKSWEKLTPENVELWFDLDGTLLTLNEIKKDDIYWGEAVVMLRLGLNNKELHPLVKERAEVVAKAHELMENSDYLLNQLSDYTICFASNKDRVSYDSMLQFLDNKSLHTSFGELAHKVLVYKPDMVLFINYVAQNSDLSASYVQLVELFEKVQENSVIKYSEKLKPDPIYFEKMSSLSHKKYQIFFDDRFESTKVAHNPEQGRIGILVNGPLSIAIALNKLGIISKEVVQKIVDDLIG